MRGKRRLYVLDTSAVLCLLAKNKVDLERRAKLLSLLDTERDAVFAITAPGLAESFDTPLPTGVQVLDMTMQAGMIASSIRQVWYKSLTAEQRKEVNTHMVKVDHLILATAEAWNATAFFAEDRHFANLAVLAGLKVQVRSLPNPTVQGKLF